MPGKWMNELNGTLVFRHEAETHRPREQEKHALHSGRAVGQPGRGRGRRLSSEPFPFKKSRPDHSAQALDPGAGRGSHAGFRGARGNGVTG